MFLLQNAVPSKQTNKKKNLIQSVCGSNSFNNRRHVVLCCADVNTEGAAGM